jgi:uncharacterized protein
MATRTRNPHDGIEGRARPSRSIGVPRTSDVQERLGIPERRGAEPFASSKHERRILQIAPAVIVATMWGVFHGGVALFGTRGGYVAGFLVYWIVWGICFPLWIVGSDGVRRMFMPAHPRFGMSPRRAIPLLALPPLLGALFIYPMTFPSTSGGTLLVFAAIALVNGTVEEILWRGLFVTTFSDRALTGYVVPAVWFGLLQLAALSVYPYDIPGGPATAVIGAFAVGLIYGAVAWRFQSVRWTVLSHVLMNLTGIGAVIYFAV